MSSCVKGHLFFKSYELSKFPNPISYKMTVSTLILLKSMMHTLKQLLNNFLKLVLSRYFLLPVVESYLNYFYKIKRYDPMRAIPHNLPIYLAVDVFMSTKDDAEPVELFENKTIRIELNAYINVNDTSPFYYLILY